MCIRISFSFLPAFNSFYLTPQPMKNIFVPVDFSQHSKAALEIACDLAMRNNATLNVFHVIENPRTSILLPDLYLEDVPDSKNFNEQLIKLAIEKIGRWMPENSDKVKVVSYASVGNLFDEFRKYAKENPPELIVMGVKGYNERNRNTIGAFTERLIKKADCPILTVKAGFVIKDFVKIMMIADFIENEATIAFEIKRLNKLFNARVEILRINTPQDFESDNVIESKFQVFQDKYRLENCFLFTYNHSFKEEGIILAAKKSKADLVAIASQSKNIVERFLPFPNENSLQEDFLDHLEYPIWIFKPYFKLPAELKIIEEIKGLKFF